MKILVRNKVIILSVVNSQNKIVPGYTVDQSDNVHELFYTRSGKRLKWKPKQ